VSRVEDGAEQIEAAADGAVERIYDSLDETIVPIIEKISGEEYHYPSPPPPPPPLPPPRPQAEWLALARKEVEQRLASISPPEADGSRVAALHPSGEPGAAAQTVQDEIVPAVEEIRDILRDAYIPSPLPQPALPPASPPPPPSRPSRPSHPPKAPMGSRRPALAQSAVQWLLEDVLPTLAYVGSETAAIFTDTVQPAMQSLRAATRLYVSTARHALAVGREHGSPILASPSPPPPPPLPPSPPSAPPAPPHSPVPLAAHAALDRLEVAAYTFEEWAEYTVDLLYSWLDTELVPTVEKVTGEEYQHPLPPSPSPPAAPPAPARPKLLGEWVDERSPRRTIRFNATALNETVEDFEEMVEIVETEIVPALEEIEDLILDTWVESPPPLPPHPPAPPPRPPGTPPSPAVVVFVVDDLVPTVQYVAEEVRYLYHGVLQPAWYGLTGAVNDVAKTTLYLSAYLIDWMRSELS